MFDLSFTDLAGSPVKGLQRPGRSPGEMRRTIGRVLVDARRNQRNVIIRPRSATALLIQLDDFTAEKVAEVEQFAFMTVCTSPGNYQVWLAVLDGPQESDKEVARQFRTRVRRGRRRRPVRDRRCAHCRQPKFQGEIRADISDDRNPPPRAR